MIVVSKNIRYADNSREFLGRGREIQYVLLYTCVQTPCSVAFTGRVLRFSVIVVISRHGRENQRTLCIISAFERSLM